jgi:hypothetical protein
MLCNYNATYDYDSVTSLVPPLNCQIASDSLLPQQGHGCLCHLSFNPHKVLPNVHSPISTKA